MAGFPTGPTNGQQVTANGILYVYNSTKTAWLRNATTGANLTANSLTITSTVNSTSTITGALIVTGGVGVSGNIYASYIAGNGSLLTGLPASYSNAQVASYLPTYSGSIGTLTNLQTTSFGVGTAASGTAGEIRATNAITAFYSDKRLKTNFKAIENPLDKVDQLTGLMYTQNALAEQFGYNDYSQQVGVFAQDVQQVQPEAVKPAPFDIAEDGTSSSGENYLTVQYEKLIPLLIEAIKELRAEVNQLKGL
jgi:hypothetical protein